MARMNGFRQLTLVCTLMVTGCQTSPDFQELMRREQAKATLKKPNGVIHQMQAAAGLPAAENVYKRRLSLTFQPDELTASQQNAQLIHFFFSSLPTSMRLSVVISVAPSSAKEPFKTLKDSSTRLQSLKTILHSYTPHIELIYQPSMTIDTAGIHVTGIPVSGASHVQ